ncbi:MAG: helix-turn-helix transcriptional regulator [Sphingobacteriaceae bacterium]|nr:helix-turn-helix transcriptional regulator [Sphingobacteriaceae bacterium]
MNNFRTNLILQRQKIKLSQQELADLLNVNQKTIGSYEEGRAVPKLDLIIEMANLFKITVDQLIK